MYLCACIRVVYIPLFRFVPFIGDHTVCLCVYVCMFLIFNYTRAERYLRNRVVPLLLFFFFFFWDGFSFAYSIVYYGKEGKIVEREQCRSVARTLYSAVIIYNYYYFFSAYYYFFFFHLKTTILPSSKIRRKEREPFHLKRNTFKSKTLLFTISINRGIHVILFILVDGRYFKLLK